MLVLTDMARLPSIGERPTLTSIMPHCAVRSITNLLVGLIRRIDVILAPKCRYLSRFITDRSC